ncbi:MAG: STAS domain-containing protein [Candidatus Omnitrophica bacterium]|nr:STAS domain-containing protein [Candidatus Omnitrophota bacterium]MDD5488700.1 STAS domain-containing protein [Candidatus Omnitrophota bacterium]
MQVRLEQKGDVSVFKIAGNIDIETSPEMKKEIDKAMAGKQKKVVMNLREVSYIDSSGLATLVEVLKNLRSYGGKMKISDLSDKISGLFEITKLNKLFDIVQDEASAINSF